MKYFLVFSWLFLSFIICAQEKESTAAPNVYVLDQLFEMPSFDRQRGIRLYLPPSYDSGTYRYPVIYMHDGQNLFDVVTSYADEWGVDEILNEIAEEGGPEFIVVGIDNGGDKRTEELTPFKNYRGEGGQGKLYMEFIVEVIKPYIDTHYRTLKDVDNTAIIGSSLGGLISHYAIYQYPEIFGKAGIYSPSYWFSFDEIRELTINQPIPSNYRIDLLVGKQEGAVMYEPMKRLVEAIDETGHSKDHIRSKIDDLGKHNEKFWNREFKDTILWLFDKN